MVTDFQYVADVLDKEAEKLEGYSRSFDNVGQTGTAQRLTMSARHLRDLAQWTRDKIGSEVNEIVQHEKEQWDGVTAAITGVVKQVSSNSDRKEI